MKALVISSTEGDGEVTVCDVFYMPDREAAREGIKQTFGSEYVWFEDEVGTVLDPIRGPNPKFGPLARKNGAK
jgi:hypothetical protein